MNQMELSPCPFCGGAAEFSVGKTGDGQDWHYIECGDCGAVGPRVNYAAHNIQVKEANAEAWNERADSAEITRLQKELDTAREALDTLREKIGNAYDNGDVKPSALSEWCELIETALNEKGTPQ